MIFESKKKKIEEAKRRAEAIKRDQVRRALTTSKIQMPNAGEFVPYTKEYRTFLQEIKQEPITLYEKACAFTEKIFPIEPDQKTAAKIDESLKAAYVNATPKGSFSFAFLVTLLCLVASIIFIVLGGGLVFGGFALAMTLVLFWYLYNYPHSKAKAVGIQMSADAVLGILYMVIYMRLSPNLEGAIKFASKNLGGPLSWDLKKLVWDIETGTYGSANEALTFYIDKWKDKNKEFAEALSLLKNTAIESKRREAVYEETIDVILNGTRERAKHYASGLRMPMTLVYALGILLPVMGLILFPIVMIFVSESVKPSFVFFGYNILLPTILFFLVNYLLSSKPPTFSPPDISAARGVPPMGKIKIEDKLIPIWPIALVVGIPFIILGLLGISSEEVYLSVNFSILIILGLALPIVTYAFLDSYQKMRVRNDIEKIENEFGIALFQLGNVIAGGTPIESAIDKARHNMKETKIAEMFEIISLNMKKFGCTFEQALFDKKIGAIYYYPSNLITSIMQTILQSAKKSIKTAAGSMVVISRYLKGVHDVKEEIDDILGETTASMGFLAMFLAPLVSGITVTMAVVILQILTRLGASMQSITSSAGSNMAQSMLLIPWAMGGELPISPPVFQIIVGIYMIETAVLLSAFLNGIKYGRDPVGMRYNIWSILLFGIIIYIISWAVTYTMFAGPLSSMLEPMGT